MNVLWPLLFAWCMLMKMPDWSKFDLSDPSWIAVSIAIIGAMCATAYKVIPWVYRTTTYRHHNFKISILNRLPISSRHPIPIVPEPASLKIIGIGEQRLFVEIKATCRYKPGFPVKSINFRCLQLSEVGTDAPVKSGVPITRVRDPENIGIFRMRDDDFNGIEGEYTDIRGLGRNRCLYFEIVLNPAVEWTGYLSFKARDSAGFCSYSRYSIEVVNTPAPVDDELAQEYFQESFNSESQLLRPT